MKTLRFQLPVLDTEALEEYLDLVTNVPGVMAALVDAPRAALDVIVASSASALMLREELRAALGQQAVDFAVARS